MKKILALLVGIALFAGIPIGCIGSNGLGTEKLTLFSQMELCGVVASEDEVKTEKTFYALVEELKEIKGNDNSDTLYCYDYNDNAYLFILNLFASNKEKKEFAVDNKYRSHELEVEYIKATGTLLLKFKNKAGKPKYKIIFKGK